MTESQNQKIGACWRELLAQLDLAWPPDRWRDLGVVVGCSGGADSVALLTALCQLRRATGRARGFLVAAHFNHRLRGAESDADEALVRQLAADHEIRFESRSALVAHRDEATMRGERTQFLTDVAYRTGARYIALAHSLDDNVETVLHHLLRGTGPAGLAGIGSPLPLGDDLVLVRPLLATRRCLIRRGLEETGQAWRDDSSNENTDYRRNWIRHRLIPLVESEYPCAAEAIGRAIDAQRAWRSVIEQLARDWLATHRRGDERVQLRRDPDAEQPILIAAAQRIWTERGWPRGGMNRQHWIQLASTIAATTDDPFVLPGNVHVRADPTTVFLSKSKPPDSHR